MAKHNCTIKPTGTDNSSQNGRGECQHGTFANVMRCMSCSGDLGSEFWSDALLHSACICNGTHHAAIDPTPHEAWAGETPNIKHIVAFGTPAMAKAAGTRSTKIDPHTHNGIFLRFTGTAHNVVCHDIHSGQVKTAAHREHDEHGHSNDAQHRSTALDHLINTGKDANND